MVFPGSVRGWTVIVHTSISHKQSSFTECIEHSILIPDWCFHCDSYDYGFHSGTRRLKCILQYFHCHICCSHCNICCSQSTCDEWQAIVSFVTMQLQLCSVFFTFSLGTRTHYFGRTILHGGAKVSIFESYFFIYYVCFFPELPINVNAYL